MSEPKRMHPIAAVVNTARQIKEMIVPFVAFFVFGSKGTDWDLYYWFGSIGILILFLLSGIVSWYRFNYRIQENELRIEYGLFVKRKRYIPFERIQSIDYSEGILQRLFGLVKVKVETAGSAGTGDSEAVLTAISKEEAANIQNMLLAAKKGGEKDGQEKRECDEKDIFYKMSGAELVLLASTSGGPGVIISGVLAFVFQFEEFIPYERVFKGFSDFAENGIVFIATAIFAVFVLAWAAAVAGTFLKYAGFTVRKEGKDLVITRGMLEKRQFTIPLHRIQAVRISENLIRQPFGLASAYVESAGGSVRNEGSSKVLILPVVKKHRIPDLLTPYLEGYEFDPAITGVPKRAFARFILKGWMFIAPLAVLAIVFFMPWGFLSILLFPVSAFWSWLVYRDTGWSLDGGVLTLRYRGISRNTVFMDKRKVQSLNRKESPFQKKRRLSTIGAIVKSGEAGSGGKVTNLEKTDADKIYSWFSREALEQQGAGNTEA
ncbi:PH domain-containing protein [Mesobacillus zeae]|uniref:YdbS-like PH domain-containing protein n=1 Tax=Mesobacillus zeae TaxID=1917180 RepID=A0A398B369_9BACI|nr:PH domain-containing protein [Mesobacillus zeae]RID84242.1 hypothetical protein D1970_13170 [Mesobacillus zeae]